MPVADPSSLRLAEAVAAKLCHDLAGTIGSLSGTIELLVEDFRGGDPLLPIAAEAVAALSGRLRLLRAACAGPQEQLAPADIAELCRHLSPSGRVTADLSGLDPAPLPPALAQLLLCALLIGADGLPRGGVVAAHRANPGLTVTLLGPRAAWPEPLAAALAGTATGGGDQRGVLGPLTVLIAQAQGIILALHPPGMEPPALTLRPAAARGLTH